MSNSWKCVGIIFPTLICIRPRSVIWNQSRNTLRLHQKAGKARFWDCFLSQNDLIASTSQNPPQKCRELKQSRHRSPTLYLCATTFHICVRFYFIFVRKLLSAICGAITRLISLHSSTGSINATLMTRKVLDFLIIRLIPITLPADH